MLENAQEYKQLLNEVIKTISEAKQRAMRGANAEVIMSNWQIGKLLDEHSEWGNSYIDSLSKDIRTTFPGVTGYSVRNLKYMMKFAREVSMELCSKCCTIPWGHIMMLLDKTEPGSRRDWYIDAVIENGWSRIVLGHQIDLKLYERQALSGKVSNFSRTLPTPQSELVQQQLKDPYVFDFITARQSYEEREVEQQMVDNVTKLLLELGTGFAFMGRQYHFVVGGEDFYIDLLFYNTKLHCYVAVELKNDKFRPEYAGKLSFYISSIDGELATDVDNPTIGLLLCKEKNDVVAEYTLQDIDQPIGVSEYRLGDVLPGDFAKYLPSPEDLQSRI
ncbi:MAG: DUF1016 family protein [Atopobiaceae bacterium]|nr:DUF1016 family protein [Atopobiaceae bacterium]